ncbi:hypothetical protein DERF_011160 [Dermatophagoides farinae]|uniref:Uncharacterized protein n=1 Tax=Dermatophagoides farinae TaxID=6954 RepID=A0A922HUE1_DERFA|nr:hypothetical protein DERF_011160 [Dermatophagoides farinae]
MNQSLIMIRYVLAVADIYNLDVVAYEHVINNGCFSMVVIAFQRAPNIFDILLLCISGHAFNILRRSSFAQTINAFIGRFICPCSCGFLDKNGILSLWTLFRFSWLDFLLDDDRLFLPPPPLPFIRVIIIDSGAI